MKEKVIIHMDADAFFASCHIIKDQIKNQKVVVTSDLKKGIILSATYDCKKEGVYTTMPIWKAKKIIPDLKVFKSEHKIYQKISHHIFNHIKSIFGNKVFLTSIDECYIDITEFVNQKNTVYIICKWIKEYIYKISNLNFSIGASNTFFYAKMASKFAKPNGIKIIKKNEQINFIQNINIKDIHRIGKNKQIWMYDQNIFNGKDLLLKEELIINKYKKEGIDIINNIKGIYQNYIYKNLNKSFGKETSIILNSNLPINYYVIIENLLKELYNKILFYNIKIKCIKIKLQTKNKKFYKQKTINKYTDDFIHIKKYIINIFDSLEIKEPINLIGIYFANFIDNTYMQKNIFDFSDKKINNTDKIIFKLNQRYNKKIFFNIKNKML